MVCMHANTFVSSPTGAQTAAVLPASASSPPTKVSPHQELVNKLALLKQKPRTTPTEVKALHGEFTDLEGKAIELKSVDFYKARGDFYFECAQAETSVIRQPILYANALQDYRQTLIYNPFAEGVLERIEVVEAQSRPKANPTQFFATASPPAPAKREELKAEEIAKLEQIKARLRQQQAAASPTNAIG